MRWLGNAVGLLIPYAAVVGLRSLDCLYILQLERYKPDRYRSWLASHRRILVSGSEIALQVLTVAAAAGLIGVHWIVPVGRLGADGPSRPAPTPIGAGEPATAVDGPRGPGGGDGLAGWPSPPRPQSCWRHGWCSWRRRPRSSSGGIAALAVVGIAAPGIVLLAAHAILPWEDAVATRFLVEADRRMRGYPGRVLGITGSYGKTSTKYVVADLLAPRYRVLKTPAGVNTTMGITRVVREELRDDHEVFVVEMSAYGPGEIREVCDIVRPSLGILTAVGVQHLERFGTPERIAEAKYELLAALPSGAPAVVNADDPVCLGLAARARTDGKRVLLYGMDPAVRDLAVRGMDVAVSARGSRFRVVTAAGDSEVFDTKLLGRWNLSNVLGGIAAALEWERAARRPEGAGGGPDAGAAASGDPGGGGRHPDSRRGQRQPARGRNGAGGPRPVFRGVSDPHHARDGRTGPIEAEENRRFGEKAASVCDYVVLVGPEQTRPIRQGLTERGFPAERVLVARGADEVADRLAGLVRPGDILLYENRLPDTYLEVAS